MIVAGVMEHIEEAGVHSGDSACAIPPYSLPGPVVAEIREATCALARRLQVKGLMNVQFAVKEEEERPVLDVIEVNPRASRTVPFVSKATGVHLAKACARIMMGESIAALREEGLLPSDRDGGSLPTSRSKKPSSRSSSFPAWISCSGRK